MSTAWAACRIRTVRMSNLHPDRRQQASAGTPASSWHRGGDILAAPTRSVARVLFGHDGNVVERGP
jgi:hypothetical protein